jgi:hypothetical protein
VTAFSDQPSAISFNTVGRRPLKLTAEIAVSDQPSAVSYNTVVRHPLKLIAES